MIPKLKAKGVSVAVIKRCPHGFQWEDGNRGKDSELFLQAGSEAVGLWGPDRWALLLPSPVEPDLPSWATRFFPNVDIVLIEGGKGVRGIPKIAVGGGAAGKLPSIPVDELLAVVSDANPCLGTPCFSPHRVEELVEFLAQKIKKEARSWN
jgi:molybdopterin-guanine dinucleotide biosynthesis protein MobB